MIPELHQNLVSYIGRFTTLKKVAAHEWAGPCPACGGTNRLHVHDEKGFFCRQCIGEKFGDLADFTKLAFGWTLQRTLQEFHLDRRADPAEVARMEAERKARQQAERQAEVAQQEQVHAQLTACPDWMTYHHNLDIYPDAREMWHKRGLPDDWIEYYRLGYCPSRRYMHDGEWFERPSLTIPTFRPVFMQNPEGGADVSWRVVQLKHRLLGEQSPGGKYRPHMAGAGNQLFFTDVYQQNVTGDLLLVEGEIKAMVTWAALWIGDDCLMPNVTVIGMPGKSAREDWLEQFNLAERVYICLDPDAQETARRLAARIAVPVKNILLPDKIDDLITLGVLDGPKLFEILEGANNA